MLNCHGFDKVPVTGRLLKVESLTLIIAENEREYRVLHEVVERAAGHLVQVRQVLEVGHEAVVPHLLYRCQVLRLDQMRQVHGVKMAVQLVTLLQSQQNEQYSVSTTSVSSRVGLVVRRWPSGADNLGSFPGGNAEKGNLFPCCLPVLRRAL